MKRCVAWGPGQRSSVWHARYSGFPTQKLSEKGQAWSFWVFKEASLHSHDWLMGSTSSLQGWDWKFCLITGLVFLAANPHPWMGAKSHLPWSFICNWRLRDQMLPFLPLSIRTFQGFWKLWARNREWRPNVYRYVFGHSVCMLYVLLVREGRRGPSLVGLSSR
jgi:hypothetical protein